MRLCFIIACMAAIGVGVVHFRKRQSIARHQLLGLDSERVTLRRTANQLESDLGELTDPKQVAARARMMNIEPDRQPLRLAGPTDRTGVQDTHRTRN
ncbi:MAG: hypothetical protein GY794_18910 [bacterium]|nr:hypothetical protein [bacterium]